CHFCGDFLQILSEVLKSFSECLLGGFLMLQGEIFDEISSEQLIDKISCYCPHYTENTMDFIRKLADSAGVGPSSYMAEALLREPLMISLNEARLEAEAVLFGAVDQLFAKTGVKPEEIGIVIANCSIFCPLPSLSDMIVNRYRLNSTVLAFNLSGMRCTAGLSAIKLAKQLLQLHEYCYSLIVSTETLTENFYKGNNHLMLAANCVFRVGGAAILLSNHARDKCSSKYELIHTVHNHTASSDTAYNCVFLEEDSEGVRGVTITKDLVAEASKAITTNLAMVGPLILTILDKIKFLTDTMIRFMIISMFALSKKTPVLDGLQKSLNMTDSDIEASRMTLYRFGNISSSSIWYVMAYGEAKGRIKKGHHVWQLAFGSGFKCCSIVWRANRTIDHDEDLSNPWRNEIDEFPVKLDCFKDKLYLD
ncbi:3-ketoacyl-CoA synthase 2-like protein, partial [Drosera capensis]